MFEGNRGAKLAIGGIVAAALLAAGLSLWGYQREHAKQRESAASYQSENAREQTQATCVQVARSRSFSCVIDAPQAESREQYAAPDLRAQQDMAEWAFAMFLASCAGVVATLAGVVYVALTLHETRIMAAEAAKATSASNKAADAALNANEHFADASKRQLRAYVAVMSADLSAVATGASFSVDVCLKNVGQTPAKQLRVWTRMQIAPKGRPWDTDPPGDVDALNSQSLGPTVETHSEVKWTDGVLSKEIYEAICSGDIEIRVFGEAVYLDAFDDVHHTYWRMWHGGPKRKAGILANGPCQDAD